MLSNGTARGSAGTARTIKMKRVILSVLSAILAVGVSIWVVVGYQARLRLEEENQGLRQQLDQMAELTAENERLSNLVAQASQSRPLSEDQLRELLRLRSEVGALRQQGKAPERMPDENRQAPTSAASVAPATNYWPRTSWAFAGYAHPNTALETALWAANKGDVKAFLGSVTGEAQKTAEGILAVHSESEVGAYVSAGIAGWKSLRVINSEVQDEDSVVVTTEIVDENGPQTKKALMKKVGGDWKLSGYVP